MLPTAVTFDPPSGVAVAGVPFDSFSDTRPWAAENETGGPAAPCGGSVLPESIVLTSTSSGISVPLSSFLRSTFPSADRPGAAPEGCATDSDGLKGAGAITTGADIGAGFGVAPRTSVVRAVVLSVRRATTLFTAARAASACRRVAMAAGSGAAARLIRPSAPTRTNATRLSAIAFPVVFRRAETDPAVRNAPLRIFRLLKEFSDPPPKPDAEPIPTQDCTNKNCGTVLRRFRIDVKQKWTRFLSRATRERER